jgi:hypothetical protein
MFLFDPSTGETFTEPRNDMDKTTIDACKGAIDLLKQEPCGDAISKASVFEILGNLMSIPYDFGRPITERDVSESMDKIRDLPPVQPEKRTEERTETNACDCISRQAAIRIASGYCHPANIAAELAKLPSAQPEQRWIPFKTRPLTKEEKEEYPEWDGILDCKLPDDGQRILVSVSVRGHESVQYDEFYTDDGSYLDSGYEIGTEATAWMPLPEPYKAESEE